MPDYQKGKIYKTWDDNYTKCYIGSTVEDLSKRMTKHRDKYKQYLQKRTFNNTAFKLFEEFGIESCKIELLELYPCSCKSELEAREGHHIRNDECVNRRVMGRSKKEHYRDNYETIRAQRKEYRDRTREHKHEADKKYRGMNKETITEHLKEKRLCECGCYISVRNMASHKKSPKHLQLLKVEYSLN